MPKGYWIAHITVRTPERYPEYIAAAQPAYARFGARFIIRGGRFEAVEGEARARHVVIEFPSLQAALDCYNSPEYQTARAIRREIADGEVVIVEGHDG
jgi:uncharacterized protein (DUF1330 family)